VTHVQKLDSFGPKTRPDGQLVGPASPTLGQFRSCLFATSSPCAVESRILVQFGILEDIYTSFTPYGCLFHIRCPCNDNSTKLVELVRNKHLSSKFCMEIWTW
jgi:hypothetical protein